MIAALGQPESIPWLAVLEAGPDEQPIREHPVEHGQTCPPISRIAGGSGAVACRRHRH